MLADAGAATATALVLLSRDPAFNVNVARIASEQFDIERIVMLEQGDLKSASLETNGVRVIRPELATMLSIEGAVRFPASFDLLSHQDADMDVGETRLTNRALHKQALRELRLPGDVLIIGVRRFGDRIVAHGDTILELGDVVLLGVADLPEGCGICCRGDCPVTSGRWSEPKCLTGRLRPPPGG